MTFVLTLRDVVIIGGVLAFGLVIFLKWASSIFRR